MTIEEQKQIIRLTIARLERENAQLIKLLETFGSQYDIDQINDVLDLQLKNIELIEKLKRGLI